MTTIDIQGQIRDLIAAVHRDELSPGAAIKQVDRTLRTFRRVALANREDPYTLQVLLGIGESYEMLSSFDKALTVYDEALDLARRLDDRASEAALHRQAGRVYHKRNRWEDALSRLKSSRDIYEELEDESGITRCRVGEASVDFSRGDYPAADDAFRSALETAERIDDQQTVAGVNLNLGLLANIRGDFDEAIARLQNSLTLYEQMDKSSSVARLYHNLGICHSSQGRWTEALDSFERSRTISQDEGNLRQSAMTDVHRAAVFLELGDSQVVASLCARAIETFQEIGFPVGIAEAYKVLGRLFTRKKEWATAQGLLEEGLKICEQYDDALGYAEILRDLGRLHQEREDPAAAKQSYETALDRFQALGAGHETEVTRSLIDAL